MDNHKHLNKTFVQILKELIKINNIKKIKVLIKYYLKIYHGKRFQKSVDIIIPQLSKGYKSSNPVVNKNCSELEVKINHLTSFIVKDLFPIVGVSPYPINELLLMTSSVVTLKPNYIFEWGTHLGISARIFYEICQKYKINTVIHSIDLPDYIEHIEHPGENRGIKVKGIKKVILHQGDGLDTSIEIIKKLNNTSQLLFFLDGDHSYDSVNRELNGINEAFPNAAMLIHDTFYQSSESKYNIGPYQAVMDFLEKHPNQYKKISTNIGLPGITLLYTEK